MDILACILDVWFRLGFQSAEDAAIDDRWVTIDECYQFADDATKALARTSFLFPDYDESITTVPGQAIYDTVAGHIFTESAWLVYPFGGAVQQLRLTSAGQLFALDAAWSQTTGNPTRMSIDATGVGFRVLYPAPVLGATLAEVMETCPATVAAGASVLPVSPVLVDLFSYAMLAGAYSKESDSAKPEVAAHAAERVKLYAAVVQHLWGAGR